MPLAKTSQPRKWVLALGRCMCFEFSKRLNPDLPFYYHTSSHTRYYEGLLPEFNVPARKPRKTSRAPRREQPSVFAPHRATMPVRGSLSVRPKFHNVPLDLPPLALHMYMNIHIVKTCNTDYRLTPQLSYTST